jgi:hypothetical protein
MTSTAEKMLFYNLIIIHQNHLKDVFLVVSMVNAQVPHFSKVFS